MAEETVSDWRGRRNKTYQDSLPVGERERVNEAARLRDFQAKHKPVRSADYAKFRSKNV